MDEENNFNNETLIKSKPNKNKKKILIASAIIIVLAGVGGGAYAMINSNPKVKVFNALKATSLELEEKQTFTEKIAGKGYLDDLEEKGTKQSMEFTLNSSNYPELKQANGVGISIDSSCDTKNKKLMLNMGGKYKGTSIADAQLYTDNKKLMISVPKIYNSYFTFDAENIQDQYNSSVFAQSGNKLPNQEISAKVFGDDDTLSGKALYDSIIKGYLKANGEKLATIGKNIKVEKSKETKNIEIGGVNQECTGYDVVISSQDAKEYIKGIFDYALEDQEIKKAITQQVKYSYMQQNKNYSSPKAMVDDMYEQMKKAKDDFESSVNFSDVNIKIYIDKKDRAVSIESNTSIDNGIGEKVDVKYSSDFTGKGNIGDIIKISAELGNDKGKFKMDLDNITTTKDDTTNEEMNLVLSLDKTPINIKMKSDYNNKNGDFDASADLSAQGQGVTASCNGKADFDKSSKKMTLEFDKIDIKANAGSKPINISLGGFYSIAPLDNPIEEPTGEKLELFKLSQNKIAEIAQEIQKNAMGLAKELK